MLGHQLCLFPWDEEMGCSFYVYFLEQTVVYLAHIKTFLREQTALQKTQVGQFLFLSHLDVTYAQRLYFLIGLGDALVFLLVS